ncbi:SMI1/KNR4 family protein [Amycolatopsis rhizosphaerae]|uniref:SMI1/KNR4 family protein n=1 Tax=Amycolatopsis rhizosphaerae TaxID=2053003 RepID=A0A558CIJ3_9PSEU|nr:SMI1/KNR4 family protein [Amycolatopsis rhizosphaerae]TVT48591.1 SMI1/KNR4 family protein [Amycolatopsis rhizosphaerae]
MDWKPWLTRWSEEWISAAEPDELDSAVLRDRWLGFAPATEDEVAAAEARLGLRLPPSYREFLLTTNGWRDAGCFVYRMRDTSDLGWLRDHEPYWEDWEGLSPEDNPDLANDNRFTRGLLLSQDADAGILFLDPGDVDEAGEWAAYSLFSWRAEAPARFASFRELMEDLYAEFHQIRRPEGETRDFWDAQVEQARLDVLAGNIDGPDKVLERAEDFGRVRATVLRAQILLFLGRRDEAGQLLGRLLHPSFVPGSFLTDPLFTEEFLPYLFGEHTREAPSFSVLDAAMIGEQPQIMDMIAEHEPRFRVAGQGFVYGNPEFDEPIRRARVTHADDTDALWAAIREAMPHWRPRTADHIAPVALLADPVLAAVLTPERGRELLAIPSGGA